MEGKVGVGWEGGLPSWVQEFPFLHQAVPFVAIPEPKPSCWVFTEYRFSLQAILIFLQGLSSNSTSH